MITIQKRFFRFRYAAIKRYGDRRWTATDGYVEINPGYIVNVGTCEKGLPLSEDCPYIIELSNGTKFLLLLHHYGIREQDVILSEEGEYANSQAIEINYANVMENIDNLNRY